MNKVIKIIGIIFALFAFGAYTYWHFNDDFNMDIMNTETDIHTNADSLMTSFIINQEQAITNYKEKIIEIEGVIKEISYLNKKCTVFLEAKKSKEDGYILCDMQTNQLHNVQKLNKGDSVLIKGVFKGFLMDGIMLNCVLLNTTIDE